ncbi:MAG TPA: hypothetical protein VGF48_25770 [Thermoanaerobaculia bacterium]
MGQGRRAWTVAPPVARVSPFFRVEGQPQTTSETFLAHPGAYVLRIVNGDAAGANLASSAVVKLNGDTVAGPSAFNQQARVIEIPVTLAAENTLSAELRGAPGSKILIVLRPAD